MKDFLAIQELVKNNAKVEDIEKTIYRSYSTIRREFDISRILCSRWKTT